MNDHHPAGAEPWPAIAEHVRLSGGRGKLCLRQ
jgi:hypothetical protein